MLKNFFKFGKKKKGEEEQKSKLENQLDKEIQESEKEIEKIKKEKTFLRSKSTISFQLIVQGKIETKARFLAMRLVVARLLATLLRLEMFFLFYLILAILNDLLD